ncbi:TPA: 50S ribosomal protein L20 [Candidatus Bipolaricaulota bacterium]|nr:50S ribosomal protein L20 [Candidatus Bipolaricaulota bacterium]
MPRVKGAKRHMQRRRKILKLAKGFRGMRHSSYKIAKQAVMKALKNAYIDRRRKKRDFRRLWTIRINAAAREHGLSYSQFIHGLRVAGVRLNRKMLAEVAIRDERAFAELIELAKDSSR